MSFEIFYLTNNIMIMCKITAQADHGDHEFVQAVVLQTIILKIKCLSY